MIKKHLKKLSNKELMELENNVFKRIKRVMSQKVGGNDWPMFVIMLVSPVTCQVYEAIIAEYKQRRGLKKIV